MKRKIAIIGAGYLQKPLVERARDMGLETHVFAWQEGCVVVGIADYFYPISILEKEEILKVCKEIGIHGIVSIGSDIAMPTVNYVAAELGLIANSLESTLLSTNKYEMRKALSGNEVKCPWFKLLETDTDVNELDLEYPAIVKPVDRSGSLGVTIVQDIDQLKEALGKAQKVALSKKVIVEGFVEGREFSVEMISFEGKHYPITITDKVTSGEPYFVEIAHHQPADISDDMKEKLNSFVIKGLDALKISHGASHSEVLLTPAGEMVIVEIAVRMGGDFIGSDMVMLSTGYDFVKGVIEVALGVFVGVDYSKFKTAYSGVFYALPPAGCIAKITDNSESNKYVRRAVSIYKVGDAVDSIMDGAGKRAGIVVYGHPDHRLELNPLDILQYKIEK